jgi:hypothetical protein
MQARDLECYTDYSFSGLSVSRISGIACIKAPFHSWTVLTLRSSKHVSSYVDLPCFLEGFFVAFAVRFYMR